MEFRDALKHLRTELGLTQIELAAAIHVNPVTVGRWENGRSCPSRSITTALLQLARLGGASKTNIAVLQESIDSAARNKLSRSEDELYRVEHASLRELVEEATFPLYVCDIKTDELLYMNRKAEQLLGCNLRELTDRKCYKALMQRDTPCEFCQKHELTEDGFLCHKIRRDTDGAAYQVCGKKIQWNGRVAHVRYITQVGMDEILQSIVEKMNGAVCVVIYDADGAICHGYTNDRYYEMFGYTKEQFSAEKSRPYALVMPEDAAQVREAIARVKTTGQAETFRYRAQKRDGSVIHIHCNSSLAQVDGLSEKVLVCVMTDITSSLEIEQHALVFSQRLNAIMDKIYNGVAATIVRDDGAVDYVFVTNRYYDILGYTREQYHKEVSDPFSIIFAEDADKIRKTVTPLRKIGESRSLQYRAVRRDGAVIWLDVQITMMSFADVDRPVMLSVFTDITHVVEANEQLAAQRDQINEMLNTTPTGIAVVEMNPQNIRGSLRTTYYNRRFFSYSGYSAEEYASLLRKNELHFVWEEDAPILLADTQKICLGEIGNAISTAVRCRTKDGGYRWLLLTGQLTERRKERCVIHVSMVDITARKEAEDRLRISEEMLRIAAETDKRILIIYDIKANCCRIESRTLFSAKYGQILENVPQALIENGIVAKESTEDICELFRRMHEGEPHVSVSLSLRTSEDEYEWFACNASTVADADGKPNHAVLVLHNITEQRVKEAVFEKWKNSIQSRPPESYTLFRCNLSKESELDEQAGSLFRIQYSNERFFFNERTREYAEKYVHPEDKETYSALLNADSLLAMFYRGEHSATLEYREISENGEPLWRLLTIEMVEYLHSADIQAFLLFEDIDERKRAEILEIERAETDPLTGVLNRSAFIEKVEAMLEKEPRLQYALLMMDMDAFKQLNDTFGHAAGDQALIDTAAIMRSMVRSGDLICRLGGDEFLIWLRDIPYDAVTEKIAKQICEQVRKEFSHKVEISASMGIAVYPRDGFDFDALYHNADRALYRVKKAGKDNFAFFSASEHSPNAPEVQKESAKEAVQEINIKNKRRMLIADDEPASRTMLSQIFSKEYQIETVKNGAEALVRLRHFGAAISVVLLDLMMPVSDGYDVLRKMQTNAELCTIPVVVVSADDNRSSLLKAIECGAADFVTKPIDPELIRLRVQASVKKAENERLRAQNSYLQLQRDEEVKLHTVLESTGTVVVEYDWRNHVFVYANDIGRYLAGNYNHRSLWQVLLSDMVASSEDVKALQDGLLSLANERQEKNLSKLVLLKTAKEQKHWFRVNFYKQVDTYGLAEKMIITFNDVHEEVLSNERLLYQAKRDDLTGLYNRAGFFEKAAQLIAKQPAGYYVLSCINIEKFKVINDKYGTEKGDDVLRQFAAYLQKLHNGENGICCRIMADNFAVLFPVRLLKTSQISLLHQTVARLDGSIPPIRFSVGRCVVDDKQLPISAVYDRAIIAMETVKGRYDAFVATYDESMRATLLRQQEIAGQMKSALENGQFEVWLQPQINHSTGMLVGAEALVRWRHPKEGIISPTEFIPIFERNGFVYEVDKFVWEQTCRMLRKWLDQGLRPVPVSVNISRYDVFRDDLLEVITGLVEKYQLPNDLLRLEITESAFSKSTDQIIRVVEQLVSLGFVVEIDDFGSGYSSLNTLKDVPAQVLKMDMRFLENDSNAQRGGSIIESVVRMARWLGMLVIAEGVETIEQADYLKSIGCELIQGFLYSKPSQIEEYEEVFLHRAIEPKPRRLENAETWNGNAFWNPRSMETLIFNSYIGGACIFEYYNKKTELLRYNDSYAKIFQNLNRQGDFINRRDVLSVLNTENAALLRDNIEAAIRTKKEAACEVKFLTTKGEDLYIYATIRLLAQAGDRSLFYCVVNDTTALHLAKQKEEQLSERIRAIMENTPGGITAVIMRPDGTAETLFMNDRYFELVGYTRAQYEAAGFTGFELMHPEDREKYRQTLLDFKTVGTAQSLEFRAKRRDGKWVWLRDDIAVIALNGVNAPVQLSVFTDITPHKNAEEQLQFVNAVAREILAAADPNEAIMSTLRRLRSYYRAERSYVVEFDTKGGIADNTYEVCAKDVASEQEQLQNISFSKMDGWYQALLHRQFFLATDTEKLEDEKLRSLLLSQNIRSIILAPLWRDGKLLGFAGVDNPEMIPEDVASFTLPADYISLTLSRRDMQRKSK